MKRKCLSAILSAVILLSALPQIALPAAAAKVKTLGDVNADGDVTLPEIYAYLMENFAASTSPRTYREKQSNG